MSEAHARDPAAAGFHPERLKRAVEIVDEGIQQELYPGGVVWVGRRGANALVYSAGHTDFSRETPVDEDTLFDLASVTKPVATASAMLILSQEGRVHLGQPLTSFFPQRTLPHLANVTLHHLVTHTSGLPPWRDLYSKGQTREEAIDQLFAIPLDAEPGAKYAYSCLGYIVLSLVIEAATGESIDRFTSRRVFEPLGMPATMYNPPTDGRFVIAATDHCPYRKRKLAGEVHDGNAYALGGVSGNAGLFSNARDLARYCAAVLSSGSAGRDAPFAPAVLRRFFANAIPESIGGQTLGGFIHPNDMLPAGDLTSPSAVGHSGFTGTSIVLDPEYDLFTVLLTNRVCRDDDGTQFRHLRRRLFNSVLGAIVC